MQYNLKWLEKRRQKKEEMRTFILFAIPYLIGWFVVLEAITR